ncbi:MAG: hypothetical protein DI631_13580, partial [Acinetobacter johnsonii]
KGGVVGAIILGLGRALGETMAVTFVIGNNLFFTNDNDISSTHFIFLSINSILCNMPNILRLQKTKLFFALGIYLMASMQS